MKIKCPYCRTEREVEQKLKACSCGAYYALIPCFEKTRNGFLMWYGYEKGEQKQ